VTATSLWVAVQVVDYDAVVGFYRGALGLPVVDGWSDEKSLGIVFAIGASARLEVESSTTPGPTASLALEYASRSELSAVHRKLRDVTPIEQHHRGHYAFTALDPACNEIYLWSQS
jgi:hypothetical protein